MSGKFWNNFFSPCDLHRKAQPQLSYKLMYSFGVKLKMPKKHEVSPITNNNNLFPSRYFAPSYTHTIHNSRLRGSKINKKVDFSRGLRSVGVEKMRSGMSEKEMREVRVFSLSGNDGDGRKWNGIVYLKNDFTLLRSTSRWKQSVKSVKRQKIM